MKFSVLQNKPRLILDPYPHLVIENALPTELYEELDREWPKDQLLATEPFDSGICHRLKADEMLKPGKVSNVWKEFTQYHTSFAFYKEMQEAFGDLVPHIENLENTLSPRGWDKGGD
jgi:hypothetical protein